MHLRSPPFSTHSNPQFSSRPAHRVFLLIVATFAIQSVLETYLLVRFAAIALCNLPFPLINPRAGDGQQKNRCSNGRDNTTTRLSETETSPHCERTYSHTGTGRPRRGAASSPAHSLLRRLPLDDVVEPEPSLAQVRHAAVFGRRLAPAPARRLGPPADGRDRRRVKVVVARRGRVGRGLDAAQTMHA